MTSGQGVSPARTRTPHGARARAERARPTAVQRFLNRDLSWLDFNRRVLELASDVELPLLERVKLFAIVASNLDEFFAVRLAGIERAVASGNPGRFSDGRSPVRVLSESRRVVVALQAAQDRLWLDELRPSLAAAGIQVVSVDECGPRALGSLAETFEKEIAPLLVCVPLGGRGSRGIDSLPLNVAASVYDPLVAERRVVRVVVPDCLSRLVQLELGDVLIPLEDVLLHFLGVVVGPGRIEEAASFRVTRDANLAVASDAVDVVAAVEAELRRRRVGTIVRLETRVGAPPALIGLVRDELGVNESHSYESEAFLAYRGLLELADIDRPELKSPQWDPVTDRAFPRDGGSELLAEIGRHDVLVHHPYDSFGSSVAAFVAAARDPYVNALKATVYRIGDASPTLASLARSAAERKEAAALVEIKARFDERRNIDSGCALERAGVGVSYGVPGLKVHAKLTLLTRRERGEVRRYVHIGTGNYHASNACSYEDLSLFTADKDIAADIAEVFEVIGGRTQPPVLRKLLVAPWSLRRGVLDEIGRVSRAAAAGETARIRIKVNSLTDPQLVDALYAASQVGASIDIVVRGICALRPGVMGLSEGIAVRSVLGRFLEHSRILSFRTRDRTTLWIGSADLMPRNLDRRIEVLVPVEDARLQEELEVVLKALLADTASSWDLGSDGLWRRVRPRTGRRAVSAQATLMSRARDSRRVSDGVSLRDAESRAPG
jgi:polyphosphate kinase